MSVNDDAVVRVAAVSSAWVPIFRGRFCDILLPNRATRTFAEDEVIYEMGDKERTFFFVRGGVVKTWTITNEGREIIYDLRKDGDVVGELCALESMRRDRAVAVERRTHAWRAARRWAGFVAGPAGSGVARSVRPSRTHPSFCALPYSPREVLHISLTK